MRLQERKREEEEPEGETEWFSHGVEGVNVDPNGEGSHEWEHVKNPGGKAKRLEKKVKK